MTTPSTTASPELPTTSALLSLWGYVRWADTRCMDACAAVDEATYLSKDHGFSFRNLHDTLLHMMSAQDIWLSRFQGNLAAKRLSRTEIPTLAALRAYWPALHDRYHDFISSKPDLSRPLTWTAFNGDVLTLELGHLLTHVIDHASLHRGQLNSMLKLSGHTPPLVMYVTYATSLRS